MIKLKSKRGFTLLEILLVVGIIAILAGVVIVAINPSRQLKQVRDVERKSDIGEINKAMTQFYIDHGYYPASSTLNAIEDPIEICNTTDLSPSNLPCPSLVDLSELVPVYLTAIPRDPSYSENATGTGYKIFKNNPPRVYVEATYTELNGSLPGKVAYVGVPPFGYILPDLATSTGNSDGGEIQVATYAVTYDGNSNTGGSVPSSQTKTEDVTLVLRTNSGSLVKIDNTFSGWNTASDGNGTDYAVGANYTANSTTTLYAKWTADPQEDGLFRLFTNGDFEDGLLNWEFPLGGTAQIFETGGYGDNGGYMSIADSLYISPTEDIVPGIESCDAIELYVKFKAKTDENISGQIYRKFNENPFTGEGTPSSFSFTSGVWRDVQFYFFAEPWSNSDPVEFWMVPNGYTLMIDNIGWEFDCWVNGIKIIDGIN